MCKASTITREDISALFPPLPPRTHKGDMGRVLCVCGSYNGQGPSMCGAAYFSAAAAYLSGAGIVEIFTHRKNYEALATRMPEAVFSLYDTEKESSDEICRRLCIEMENADSLVLGCGLSQAEISKEIVKATLKCVSCPLVIDADGINIIANDPELWSLLSSEQRAQTVITPHAGEMSRLCGSSIQEILSNTVKHAEDIAHSLGINCLLKDHNTVTTDGVYTFINNSGNPGMACGGMGDILSGIIGALLARHTLADWADDKRSIPDTLYRSAVAAYIHGLAGDIAAEKTGRYSLKASDLLSDIPTVIKNYS